MKLTLHVVLWIAVPAILVGLLLGVGIGRVLSPIGLGPAFALEEGAGAPLGQEVYPATISPKALEGMVHSNVSLLIVDARDWTDYSLYHIPGSESIPLGSHPSPPQISTAQMVVVYCTRDCDRDTVSRDWARPASGNLRILEGGMGAWKEAGYAVSR